MPNENRIFGGKLPISQVHLLLIASSTCDLVDSACSLFGELPPGGGSWSLLKLTIVGIVSIKLALLVLSCCLRSPFDRPISILYILLLLSVSLGALTSGASSDFTQVDIGDVIGQNPVQIPIHLLGLPLIFPLLAVIPVQFVDFLVVEKVIDFLKNDLASCATRLIEIESSFFSVKCILIILQKPPLMILISLVVGHVVNHGLVMMSS